MPEHVHLLMSEPKAPPIAVTLNVLKTEISVNLKVERKHFWQRRYYECNVLTHAKHVETLRYMHRNPVVRASESDQKSGRGPASDTTLPARLDG
jgi:putative transposase